MHDRIDPPWEGDAPHPGYLRLLDSLPREASAFTGSQYDRPASWGYFGKALTIEQIREKALERLEDHPARQCEIAMVMAEVIESVQPDRDRFFQSDAKTRALVFRGAKWAAGWVFLLGKDDSSDLAQEFREREFLVFSQNAANSDGAIDLGPRETAAVYFLQLMVRYAMIWGRIAPGDDHEMGHYLETDLPGLVVAAGPLNDVEELLLLALMKMGAPAVVPLEYPFPHGRQVRVSRPEDIPEAAVKFPNLRVKEIAGKRVTLADECDPIYAREEFEPAREIGGGRSFFLLRPIDDSEAHASESQEPPLEEVQELGIVTTVGDERMTVPLSEYLEEFALRSLNFMKGVAADRDDSGSLRIRIAPGTAPTLSGFREAIRSGLEYHFPYLEDVNVAIVTFQEGLSVLAEKARGFREERRKAIEAESDETAEYFHYCIECQPFAREHVCIITPDRPPMCGRNRYQVMAAALFGASWHPYKRREVLDGALRGRLPVEAPLDPEKGEYANVNRLVEQLSGGKVKRVQLHSLREYPHTSCGCFGYLAFWMDDPEGIGVMERGYKGEAPGGITWDTLANRAGGKQCAGIAGVSAAYLRSPRFLAGDGGVGAIRWVSPKAYDILKDRLPQQARVHVGPEAESA